MKLFKIKKSHFHKSQIVKHNFTTQHNFFRDYFTTLGEGSVRIHTTSNMKVVDQIIPIEDDTAGGFRDVALSDSGNLVAACSNNGTLYVYLTELNVLGASCSNRLAFLRVVSF